jgi:hypothetical protein
VDAKLNTFNFTSAINTWANNGYKKDPEQAKQPLWTMDLLHNLYDADQCTNLHLSYECMGMTASVQRRVFTITSTGATWGDRTFIL